MASIPETVAKSEPPSNEIPPEGAVKIQDLIGTDNECEDITLPEGGEFKHVLWTHAPSYEYFFEEPVPAGVKEFVAAAEEDGTVPCPLFHAEPYTGLPTGNPHTLSGEIPENFSMKIRDLLGFVAWCNGDSDELIGKGIIKKEDTKLIEMCQKNRDVYKASKLDFFHPGICRNTNKMSWYKFNNTFTCNYTRTMAKGVALCFSNHDNPRGGEKATCMISYAYDTDPAELRSTLKTLCDPRWEFMDLKKQGFFGQVLKLDDSIFFCSFANYQANRKIQYKGNDFVDMKIDKLKNESGLSVGDQVKGDPFSKVIGAIDKLIVLHTADGQDIYGRKWCCYEFVHAMRALKERTKDYQDGLNKVPKEIKKPPFKFYMTGSKEYYKVVKAALKQLKELSEGLYSRLMHSKIGEVENPTMTSADFGKACVDELKIATWEGEVLVAKEDQYKDIIKFLKPASSKDSKCADTDAEKLNKGIAEISLESGEKSFDAVDVVLNQMRRRYFNKIFDEKTESMNGAIVVEILFGNTETLIDALKKEKTVQNVPNENKRTTTVDILQERIAKYSVLQVNFAFPDKAPIVEKKSIDISKHRPATSFRSLTEVSNVVHQLTDTVQILADEVSELRTTVQEGNRNVSSRPAYRENYTTRRASSQADVNRQHWV